MFETLRRLWRGLPGVRNRQMTDGGTESVGTDPIEPALPTESAAEREVVSDSSAELLDLVAQPTFALDAEGHIVVWNDAIEELTGATADEAIGHEHASEMFYPDGRRAQTLADKVLEHPRSTHEEHDVDFDDAAKHRVRDTSTMLDQHGDEKHIAFWATPRFDDNGDLLGVVEVVVDQTDVVGSQLAIGDLVTELSLTLEAVRNGTFDERAGIDDAHRAQLREAGVDVSIVEEFNQFVEDFETLGSRVESQADEIESVVKDVVDSADEAAAHIDEQNGMLEDAVSEMQSFSARMEEVAATAKEVDAAATQASEVASEGVETSHDARVATDEVTEIGDDLVGNIRALDDRMGDIETVVEVISDVAEQTNLLALNANIEAARAGSDGDGFTVVAEEVKTLADETREHTEDITKNIAELRQQTERTVDAAVESSETIESASGRIDETLAAFEEIDDAIDEAADGIAEVSRANDEQASAVEAVTATLENVRDRADRADSAVNDVNAAADEGVAALEQLVSRVDQLRGRADDSPDVRGD